METSGNSPDTDIMSYFPLKSPPRPEQEKAIRAVDKQFKSGTEIVAFQGPTGSGKSAIGICHAKREEAEGRNTFVISIQNSLLNQYTATWPAPQIEPIKGRANYRCSYGPTSDRDASRGYCRSTKKKPLIKECLKSGTLDQAKAFELHPDQHLCDYWKQLAKAVDSPITLFNFHSFLFQQRLERFDRRDLMIIDECHNVESVLLQFVEITFSDEMLETIGVKLDLTLKEPKDVLAWLDREQVVERIVKTLGGAAFTEEAADGLSPQDTDRLKSTLERIEMLQKFFEMTEWVVDVAEVADEADPKKKVRKLRVRPVFASLFARELIFSKASKVLAMSATILDPKIWARNLGIPFSKLGYVEAPCTFPLRNRPIFLDYAGNLGFKTFDAAMPAVYRKVSEILAKHRGQRGIIHAHSEKLVKLIVENVRSPRFMHLGLFPDRNKTALLEEHARRSDSVIVGSAFHEGIDLADDLSRFQILAKAPWPSMGDALVKKRVELDGSYLPFQAALRTVQAYGRSVRCFDRETEILTTDGWKTSKTLKVGDVAFGIPKKAFEAGRRPMVGGMVKVVKNSVLGIAHHDTPEPTIHIKTNAVDIVVTPDHSMVVQSIKISTYTTETHRKGRTYKQATLYRSKSGGIKKVKASELKERCKIPCAGWIKGRNQKRNNPEWFWLMGFIIGDGSFSKSRNQVSIYQSLAPSQKKHRDRIAFVLDTLTIKYKYYESKKPGECFGYKRNGAVGIWAINGYDSSRIRDMFHRGMIRRYSKKRLFKRKIRRGVDGWKTPEKRIPRWFLNKARPTLMLKMLQGMMDADGSDRLPSKRSPKHINGVYWTSDRILADRLQEMLCLCGFRSSITVHRRTGEHRKEQLCVAFVNPATSDVVKTTAVRPGPTVPVWCPSTELGSVIARRNGKAFISGNSDKDWSSTYLIDQNFERLFSSASKFFPDWFTNAIDRNPKNA